MTGLLKKIFGTLTIMLVAIFATPAWSASFDCAKARSQLEKFICNTPELDAEDTRMGELFKVANKNFPLQGFVLTTQKLFLNGYSSCLKPHSGKSPARECVDMVRKRNAQLEMYLEPSTQVYSDAKGKFTHDSAAILTYGSQGKNKIYFFGNWMVDGFGPHLPFPNGFICDQEGTLSPAKGGGFTSDISDDAVFRFSGSSMSVTGWVSCSPRNGISEGVYKRFK